MDTVRRCNKLERSNGLDHIVIPNGMILLRSIRVFIFVLCCGKMISSFAGFAARTSNAMKFSPWRKAFHSSSMVLQAQRRRRKYNHESIDDLIPTNEPGWVTVQIGSNGDVVRTEMLDRIQEAKTWESTLPATSTVESTVQDSNVIDLNNDLFKSLPKKKQAEKKKTVDDIRREDDSAKKLRGYLELNPFICTGCGSNFQTKNPTAPGFLPADKFKEHRTNAEFVRQKQEAIKTLNLACVELNSPAAMEMLRASKVDERIIESIRKFGDELAQSNAGDDASRSEPVREQPSAVLGPAMLVNDLSSDDDIKNFKNIVKTSEDDSFIAGMLSRRSRQRLANILGEPKSAQVPNKTKTSIEKPKLVDVTEDSSSDPEDVSCICQRCFRLQQYGQVETGLRPGWSSNELLTPERFETLLSSIAKSESVVLCLLDIFDLQGSIVRNLRQIAGNNPILIGVNKVDLLPKDVSKTRVQQWVHQELKRLCGFVGPRSRTDERYGVESGNAVLKQSNIFLVSCKNDAGIQDLMTAALQLAEENGRKIHVMGAANVGKSSFINRLLDSKGSGKSKKAPAVTVSNLPGTTLDFLKIKLPNSPVTIVDTPGLINRGHLTTKLTVDELPQVIPSKPINAVTFRLEPGKCVLIGGLAQVQLMEGRAFFLTFFVSNEIKLHVTDHNRADEYLKKHIGNLIFPPATLERLEAIGPFVESIVEVEGNSWKEAAADVVLPGLGWVTVTGPGIVRLKVTSIEGADITVRAPLLPFEARHTTATYTGGRIEKKSRKIGVKSYGWRA